jgi:hypothetical protein
LPLPSFWSKPCRRARNPSRFPSGALASRPLTEPAPSAYKPLPLENEGTQLKAKIYKTNVRLNSRLTKDLLILTLVTPVPNSTWIMAGSSMCRRMAARWRGRQTPVRNFMQRKRIQRGGVNLDVSSSGKHVWVFRWRVTMPNGQRVMRKRVIGSFETYRTKTAAEKAAGAFRMTLLDKGATALTTITIRDLVAHFREQELVDRGEEGRAYSTRDRCESVLKKWILPRWEKTPIDQIRTVAVEEWLRSISRAKGTKAKIRNTMSVLFNHAIRWDFVHHQSDYGSRARLWCTPECQAGAYSRCA